MSEETDPPFEWDNEPPALIEGPVDMLSPVSLDETQHVAQLANVSNVVVSNVERVEYTMQRFRLYQPLTVLLVSGYRDTFGHITVVAETSPRSDVQVNTIYGARNAEFVTDPDDLTINQCCGVVLDRHEGVYEPSDVFAMFVAATQDDPTASSHDCRDLDYPDTVRLPPEEQLPLRAHASDLDEYTWESATFNVYFAEPFPVCPNEFGPPADTITEAVTTSNDVYVNVERGCRIGASGHRDVVVRGVNPDRVSVTSRAVPGFNGDDDLGFAGFRTKVINRYSGVDLSVQWPPVTAGTFVGQMKELSGRVEMYRGFCDRERRQSAVWAEASDRYGRLSWWRRLFTSVDEIVPLVRAERQNSELPDTGS